MVSPAAAGSDQKSVGPKTDQEYNAHTDMCSRESCSVLPTRFLTGVFILLGTFLIGVGSIQIASLFISNFYPPINQTQLEVVHEAHLVEWNGPMARVDRIIQLDYLYTTPTAGWPEIKINVRNIGTETIYIMKITNSVPEANAGSGSLYSVSDGTGSAGQPIMPGTDLDLTIDTPNMISPASISLTYAVGRESVPAELRLKILNQHGPDN